MKIERGWIDTAGRCRTWKLVQGDGTVLGELTRLKHARALLLLLTQKAEEERP